MSKIAVVYWSGTGNTEKMASSVLEGARNAGAEVELFEAGNFSSDEVDKYDAIAFGCPSMGNENLEEGEFEPMFESCKAKLNNKKIGLFGSYGWGDGEWMRNWEEDCLVNGAKIVSDCVMANNEPDEEALENCIELGKALVK